MLPKLTDKDLVDHLATILGVQLENRVVFDEEKVVILDLSDLGLNETPSEVFKLVNTRILDLRGNKLTHLSEAIGQLVNLEELWLWDNYLVELPPSIGNLGNLFGLYLKNNYITYFPPELEQLKKLEWINLEGNQLIDIPLNLEKAINLTWLDLSSNKFIEIPSRIFQIESIKMLDLSYNDIEIIPPAIDNMLNLEILFIHYNKISQIHPNISNSQHLRYVNLSGNNIRCLPPEMHRIKALQPFHIPIDEIDQYESYFESIMSMGDLSKNIEKIESLKIHRDLNKFWFSPFLNEIILDNNLELLSPPPEIIARGTGHIQRYLRDLLQQSTVRYEAKLLIVGEGGTGKSSLLRSLRGEQFDLDLSTTHGIELNAYKFYHPEYEEIEVQLNTWDFGGQQIYHATHQFFLTRRSLYFVVWNARLGAEQGRLHYWLDTIRSLAPDAPIVIVATHTDERAADLNYQSYEAAYPQLVGYLQVSNKTGEGIDELAAIIAEQAIKLPLMGQPWPKTWLDAEQSLLARPDHHIDLDTYIQICTEKGVDEDIAQGTLGNYLHDLGKILYFSNDDMLSNMIVLKPNWVTKAISCVLTDENTISSKGVLQHSQLPRIWVRDEDGQRYERRLYRVFLRLMERFDLSYQLAEPGEYAEASLVPQLLPYQPPVSLPTWPEVPIEGETQLEMIYRLDFVPAGIMSWFIVRTHRYTCSLHWREGVMLEYEGHRARVELNPMLREIQLVVSGTQPHNFFTILKNTMDLILMRFEGLRVRRDVPCICHWQRDSQVPCSHYYSYESLIKRLENKRLRVQCDESYEDVPVRTLLFGIHESTDDLVLHKLEQNQQAVLNLQQGQELLFQQNSQMRELLNRNFTRLWNLEMKKVEAECPGTFFIMPANNRKYDPRNWISEEYKMYLVCQHPPHPHASGDGYTLRQPEGWWITVTPWLKYLIQFLKFAVPVGGKIVGAIYDEATMDAIGGPIALMEEIANKLPQLPQAETAGFAPTALQTGEDLQIIGPALRALHTFLTEVDPSRYWAGLHKVVTPDGNILWLCNEHRTVYDSQPLKLEDNI